ncbi:zinc ribbon domain-containing protein [Paenibacillus sp. Marseille-Q4541]|uniref:zinc ribbon domain-containing protein n=1 Tax=Paenibacillus sp. Marseille-Q4541 TaxID=2831522 RepID=UPI001BAB5244|nr:zinc ribbon domain-containing protein [Paenibacillus sp. Marseille-Q4541]
MDIEEESPFIKRTCPYCKETVSSDAIKCSHCGEMITKQMPRQDVYASAGDVFYLDRYSSILLIIVTLVVPMAAIIIGSILLFHDDTYRRDTGKLMVTIAIILCIIYLILFSSFHFFSFF